MYLVSEVGIFQSEGVSFSAAVIIQTQLLKNLKPNADLGEGDDDEPAEGIELGVAVYPWEGSDRDYAYEEVRI